MPDESSDLYPYTVGELVDPAVFVAGRVERLESRQGWSVEVLLADDGARLLQFGTLAYDDVGACYLRRIARGPRCLPTNHAFVESLQDGWWFGDESCTSMPLAYGGIGPCEEREPTLALDVTDVFALRELLSLRRPWPEDAAFEARGGECVRNDALDELPWQLFEVEGPAQQ